MGLITARLSHDVIVFAQIGILGPADARLSCNSSRTWRGFRAEAVLRLTFQAALWFWRFARLRVLRAVCLNPVQRSIGCLFIAHTMNIYCEQSEWQLGR